MQKILFFINSLEGGGAERVCVNLSNGFYENGFDISLLVLNLQNSIFHRNLNPYIKIDNLNTLHARNSLFKLSKYLFKTKPKTIFVFNYQLAVILVVLRSICRFDYKIIARNINTLSVLHEEESSFWHKYIVNFFTKIFYKRVDLLISQSEGMRDDLIKFYSIDKNKIVTINNPVNQKIEKTAKETDFSLYPKKNELLFVGALSKRKALEYLLKAFSLICPENPSLYLRIVGKGEEKENLLEIASKLEIDKNVIFEDFTDDIERYYLQAKATLLTSLYEGFPNVLIESITLGTPVVAFDCKSGPSEIIKEGVNGYLVKHLDYEAFAKAVLKLLQNDFDREKVMQTSLKYRNKTILKRYRDTITDFICHSK